MSRRGLDRRIGIVAVRLDEHPIVTIESFVPDEAETEKIRRERQ